MAGVLAFTALVVPTNCVSHGPVKYNGIIHSHSKQKPAYQVDTLEAVERENNNSW